MREILRRLKAAYLLALLERLAHSGLKGYAVLLFGLGLLLLCCLPPRR